MQSIKVEQKIKNKMKTLNKRFFLTLTPLVMVLCSLFINMNDSFAAPRAAIRGTAGTRQPVAKTTTQTTTVETPAPVLDEPEPIEQTTPAINKASQFDSVISSSVKTAASGNSDIAERIRAQRAAIEAQDATSATKTKNASGRNACDFGLRECMVKTCGKDFTKCATDGDTDLGIKFNACKRDLNCTGEEFRLFTTEIKADRDMNVRLSSYNAVIDCGLAYNDCIFTECGETFDKCLGKSAADKATKACKQIADKCKEQDSGLPGRFGNVIGRLRENAEKDVKADEERMYKLRDLMRSACTKLGAVFDERTFDCVYTVNFYAGDDQDTPKASRKRYAGDTFVCTQEWFGVDVTTYKENAYRETRMQTAATSAMLGAGVGTAAGLVTSGAISRALDTQKAQKGVDKAKADECKNSGGLYENNKCNKAGDTCAKNRGTGKYAKNASGQLFCELDKCKDEKNRKLSDDKTKCVRKDGKEEQEENQEQENEGATEQPPTTQATAETPEESGGGTNG